MSRFSCNRDATALLLITSMERAGGGVQLKSIVDLRSSSVSTHVSLLHPRVPLQHFPALLSISPHRPPIPLPSHGSGSSSGRERLYPPLTPSSRRCPHNTLWMRYQLRRPSPRVSISNNLGEKSRLRAVRESNFQSRRCLARCLGQRPTR